jgi:UV DNA damage repair endonuclease
MTVKKIGFPCKWIDHSDQVNGIKPTDDCKKYNTGATTVAWLNRQTREVAEQKLWDLMVQNLESIKLLVKRVGELDENLRMVRLSSDLLPVYTEPTWSYFWRRSDVISYLDNAFLAIGDLARSLSVRLSFHPGQFCCVVSDNKDVVRRSLEELEYHADMIRWMRYGRAFQDFKCNVHLSGRLGINGFDEAWQQMSPELRNCLTLENDEYQKNINELIKLKDKVAIVLDIHHHLISEGEYIEAGDDRVKKIIDSWRGVRPVIHFSQSREDLLAEYPRDTRPDLQTLLESGYRKQKLRAHSDFLWNDSVNKWALTHLEWADLMVEAKAKNLASFGLHSLAKELNFL